MIVTLQSERIRTIVQVAAFVEANEPVELHPLDRDGACAFVARTLTRLDYRALDRPSKAHSARRRRRGTRGAAHPRVCLLRQSPANQARSTTLACILMVAPGYATVQNCGFGSELLPFVPAAGWPDGLQGFERLVNPEPNRAMVPFNAHDDAGNARDLSVQLEPYETLHFNSEDLEDGNADKGGLAGTGAAPARGPSGCVSPLSVHAVEPTAYIRTRDGFLTDMTPSVA